MVEWEYRFMDGKKLRKAIDSDDSFKTLVELDKGLKHFILRIKDEYMKHDFEELSTVIAEDIELGQAEIEKFIAEEWNETLQDYVNDKLQWFYNLCDDWRVWVEID